MKRVLVVTGGHPFDAASFTDMFDDMPAVSWAHATQPAAQRWFHREHAGRFDAIVCYDLHGIALRVGQGAIPQPPPADVVDGMLGLLEAGQGMVFLHHALAGWPAWPAWADVLGGRFHYVPATLRDQDWPDSGYRRNPLQRLRVVAPDHPVYAGVDTIDLVDEAYLAPLFEDEVVPLLRTDAPRDAADFSSPVLALQGRFDDNERWSHPPTSDLAGWATAWRRSPIVYLQPGDGPGAFTHPGYRRLLANAIGWVASEDAHRWAAARTDQARGQRST